MKPHAFEYHPVRTTAEAIAVLAELGDSGRVLAGGQSLVPMMNFRLAQPEHLVDINPASELDYVRCEGDMLAIGAMTRQATVERSETARAHVPLLVEALGSVAHPPIRHRGTVVGSLAHADPAAELPCVAVACHATLVLAGVGGVRHVAAGEFFVGPFETALRPGELVTEVRFPRSHASGHAFVEFTRRHGDFAIAGAAVSVTMSGDRIDEATIVMCAVGPRPVRAGEAAELLRGHLPAADLVAAAADRAVSALRPGADIHGGTAYRVGVARAQVRRALLLAIDRGRRGGGA